MDIKLAYNPYFLKTTFFKKAKNQWVPYPENTAWTKQFQGHLLQSRFRKNINFEGLFTVLAQQLNENVITLHFEGRELDFLDLEQEANLYSASKNASAKFSIVRPTQFSLSDVSTLKHLENIANKMKATSFSEKNQIKNIFNAYESFCQAELSMSVVANMSSGKSTLINALLGKMLLPYGNEATTAKITEILDHDGQESFSLSAYDDDGNLISECNTATFSVLESLNKNNSIQRVELIGDIPHISSDKLRLRLKDTPGPNNDSDESHQRITFGEINSPEKPIILFVMDLSKLDTTDDAILLNEISHAMKNDRQSQERIIFVINRCDAIEYSERGKKENITEIVTKAKKRLQSKYDIQSAQIIPISAITALYQGLENSSVIDRKQTRDLDGYREDLAMSARDLVSAADLSSTCRLKLENALKQARANNDIATETMILSGVYGLQLTINEYLEKYAIPSKVNRYTEILERELKGLDGELNLGKHLATSQDVVNEAKNHLTKLEEKETALANEIYQLQNDIQELQLEEGPIRTIASSAAQPIFVKINAQVEKIQNTYQENSDIPLSEALVFKTQLATLLDPEVSEMKKTLMSKLEGKTKEDMAQLYAKTEDIVTAYKKSLSQFQGFNPDTVASFSSFSLVLNEQRAFSVKNILNGKDMEQSSFDKTEKKKRYKKNPERDGFWGFFKFWEPSEVSYEEEVSLGKHIELSTLVSQFTGIASTLLDQVSTPVYTGMCDLYEEKKGHASKLLDYLRKIMNQQTQDIHQLIAQVESKQLDIQKLQLQQKEMDDLFALLTQME